MSEQVINALCGGFLCGICFTVTLLNFIRLQAAKRALREEEATK